MRVFSYALVTCVFDPLILRYELEQNIPKMYQQTENERFRSRHSKFRARTGHPDTFFAPVTLTLPTFIYELDPCSLKTKSELSASRLSKVTDRAGA